MDNSNELDWDDYLTLILNHYADKHDDHNLTLGDMTGGCNQLPEYRGFMQMRLGDLRNFKKNASKRKDGCI
jgi:hypothetical protein